MYATACPIELEKITVPVRFNEDYDEMGGTVPWFDGASIFWIRALKPHSFIIPA